MAKPIAGISLGWIFDTVPDTFCRILNFLRESGTDAVELCLSAERLRHLVLFWNQELTASLLAFDYVSLHLPEISWRENDPLTQEVVRHIFFFESASACSPFSVFVVHPDTIQDWDLLSRCNNDMQRGSGKIVVEFPMDKNKKSGKTLEELKIICDRFPDLGFVLDVQHAYENDASLNLAVNAAKMMGSRLRHLHVSGQKQRQEGLSNHSYLHEADNRDDILRVLSHPLLRDVPRISEGEFKTCDPVAVANELACLRS